MVEEQREEQQRKGEGIYIIPREVPLEPSPSTMHNLENDDDCKAELGLQSYEDQNGQHHPIPEFLYQLTKMLTDDNSEIIEWYVVPRNMYLAPQFTLPYCSLQARC